MLKRGGAGIGFLLLLLLCSFWAFGQQTASSERMRLVEERLRGLSAAVPGLNQKVQLSMSGASAQEFLRALAQSNNLNINIDPQLNFKIYNNFTNETALNVLLFLAREQNLEISTIGSIMSITRIAEPKPVVQPREIKARYNGQGNTLSLELSNDSLGQVARKITQISQKNVVVPVDLLAKTVTAFFSDAPFDVALEKLAYANKLKLTKTADNVYIFQALADNEELYINDERNTDVRRNHRPSPSMGGGGQGGGTFSLYGKSSPAGRLLSVDATNSPILDLVKAASAEAKINYFIYSDIKGTITTRVNDITFNGFLTSMFQGTEYTYRIDNGVYLIGERKLEGLRTNKVIQLQYRSVDTVQAMIPTEWRRGVEIKEFKEQNTLLLSGSSPQITEIENYIKQIDRLVPMVLIEVTLMDIRKGKTVSTGIKAGVADSAVKGRGTIFPGIDYTFGAGSINDFLSRLGKNNSVNLGRVTPNFYVTLSALEANSNAEVRQVPKLSTLNGHTAKLSIGSRRYYVNKTQNTLGTLTSQTVITEQYNPVDAALKIDIRPIVSGDDQVTLNINIDISDFIGNPPENAPPPTSSSKFESIIRARNEDMIVLGGLERTENSESGSGVPLLSRIPVLKWFFSSRQKSTNKVVTVVFIKPTITY
ncbi:general secretion pathway protein GspD [Pararcticibacter amylolyticus]|uniref:General secretion pathway protein GspD n=2 Tax=Pararcticibacter amylolyticus TaxID=2173175 RepID=A0A2U2P9H1_9SPHI|nr:general secretion pathway protein GspD [Pararcticibacter amylolyticus]